MGGRVSEKQGTQAMGRGHVLLRKKHWLQSPADLNSKYHFATYQLLLTLYSLSFLNYKIGKLWGLNRIMMALIRPSTVQSAALSHLILTSLW